MKKILLLLFICNCLIDVQAQTVTAVFQPGASGIDANITNVTPTVNIGSSTALITRKSATDITRSLLNFDLTSIPSNAIITNAKLSLLSYNYSGTSTCYLRRITSSWSESTVTWSLSPTTTTVGQVSIPQATATTQTHTLNVTSHIQNMVNIPATNYGWMIIKQNETVLGELLLHSSDYSVTASRPKLEVTYCMPIEVKAFMTPSTNTVSADGKLKLTVTKGVPPYTYSWSDGSTNQNLVNKAPGVYTVTVTDNIGNQTKKNLIISADNVAMTFTLSPDGLSGKDGLIQGRDNGTLKDNNNIGNGFFKAERGTASGWFSTRSFLEFDLSCLPINAEVSNAVLNLYGTGGHNSSYRSNESYLYLNTSPWYESSITWNAQPTHTTSNSVYLAATTSTNQNFSPTVTSQVQNWVANPNTNFGWKLKLADDVISNYAYMVFGSCNSATVSLRPKLVITVKVKKLSATAAIDDYENETTKGKVTLNILGGSPPYNIAWNGVKYPLPSVAYKFIKDSISGIVLDSVKFTNYVDSLRRRTVFSGLYPSTNYAVIYDQANDSIKLSTSVGSKINSWVSAVGVTTGTNTINSLQSGNINYFYGNGSTVTQNGTFTAGNCYATLPNSIQLSKTNEISFVVPNSNDIIFVGLYKDSLALSGDSLDLIQNTTFNFNGNGTYDIFFAGSIIYNGTFVSGDRFALRTNETTGLISYFKNESLIVEDDLSLINFGTPKFWPKIVLGKSNATISGLKIKIPYTIGPVQILPFNKCILYSIVYTVSPVANPNPVCFGSNVTLSGSLIETFSNPVNTISLSNAAYTWLPGNIHLATLAPFAIYNTQIYSLQISYLGCTYSNNLTVNVIDYNVNAGVDEFVPLNSNVTLGATPSASGGSGNYSYLWTPSGTYSPNNIDDNPIIVASSTKVYTLQVTDNVTNCVKTDNKLVYIINEPYYILLKKTLDAGYYNSFNNKLYFSFEEEYYDPALVTNLNYKIVNDDNSSVSGTLTNLPELIGDNRFSINLSTLGLVSGKFYRLAIANEKNEVWYARFKY